VYADTCSFSPTSASSGSDSITVTLSNNGDSIYSYNPAGTFITETNISSSPQTSAFSTFFDSGTNGVYHAFVSSAANGYFSTHSYSAAVAAGATECTNTVTFASGGGGGSGATTTPTAIDCVKDGSSSTCLIQVVDNPTSDIFDGVLVFFMSALMVLWMVKKR